MEILIYLPTYDKTYIEKTVSSLLLVNSGLTIINNNKGLWINNGKIFKNDITLIQILMNMNKPLSTQFEILELICSKIKAELKQLSILVKVNNEPYFI